MNSLKKNHTIISTVLAFALIPLSGFATDIYLPSFPAMAKVFGNHADIQLSLVVFVISSGFGQLFVGSLVDSFGRYRLSLISLVIFAASSFAIAMSHSIAIVLAMRVIQGLTVALIVVSKRALIIDLYSGDKLKHYTSLFAIIWSTAPIVAPFLGGFLHVYFGWQSNFYFLGIATIILFVLELIYSGETIKEYHSFKLKSLASAYTDKLSTPDFVMSIIILGLCFSWVLMYNMASPFIIEQIFHGSAVTTGNSSLFSGVALLIGGLISKSTIHKALINKATIAAIILFVMSVALIGSMAYFPSLYLMVAIVVAIHIAGGFTFNIFYSFALSRFSSHAGIVSGLTGAGTYIITSLITFVIANTLNVKDPVMLGAGYLSIVTLLIGALLLFVMARRNATSVQVAKIQSEQMAMVVAD